MKAKKGFCTGRGASRVCLPHPKAWYFAKAKRVLTEDPTDASFILPDGTPLQGEGTHNDIATAVVGEMPEEGDALDALLRMGVMRVYASNNDLSILYVGKPTAEQMLTAWTFYRHAKRELGINLIVVDSNTRGEDTFLNPSASDLPRIFR